MFGPFCCEIDSMDTPHLMRGKLKNRIDKKKEIMIIIPGSTLRRRGFLKTYSSKPTSTQNSVKYVQNMRRTNSDTLEELEIREILASP